MYGIGGALWTAAWGYRIRLYRLETCPRRNQAILSVMDGQGSGTFDWWASISMLGFGMALGFELWCGIWGEYLAHKLPFAFW